MPQELAHTNQPVDACHFTSAVPLLNTGPRCEASELALKVGKAGKGAVSCCCGGGCAAGWAAKPNWKPGVGAAAAAEAGFGAAAGVRPKTAAALAAMSCWEGAEGCTKLGAEAKLAV